MQWIRFIEGDQSDRLAVDELLADVLFSSAIYLSCASGIAAHIATCKARTSRIQKFTERIWLLLNGTYPTNTKFYEVLYIQQQCGANRIL